MKLWQAALCAVFLCFPGVTFAQDIDELSKTLSSEQLSALEQNQQDRLSVDRLWFKHILSDEQKTKAHQAIDAEIAAVVGKPLTTEQLQVVLADANKGTLSRVFTFFNIVRVVAALLGIIACFWLFGHYLADLPKELWEIGLWGLVITGY